MVNLRIGHGYDSHRFGDLDRPLVLGTVEFPGERALVGHSDADALVHAIIDALLGASSLGDIGSHFPDTDDKWHNADSGELLKAIVAEVRAAGFEIGNVDVTVICERPRIGPRVLEIRRRLSALLGVDVEQVGIKGKTNERMDDVGEGIGIVVHAVCLLLKR
jgi:2-C-methyl-D-erythritol 2,4-cyclodiphosphate synthase